MDPVAAIRSQLPPPILSSSAATERVTAAPAAQTQPPVADVEGNNAVRQTALSADIAAARLAERDESSHPDKEARAAADAARDAYIRASIAAGISPLPLPGA